MSGRFVALVRIKNFEAVSTSGKSLGVHAPRNRAIVKEELPSPFVHDPADFSFKHCHAVRFANEAGGGLAGNTITQILSVETD